MWKVGGRNISGRKDLLDSIKNMNKKELETLMGKFNNHVHAEVVKHWGPRYLWDFTKSIPRMAVGMLAMNAEAITEGVWSSLSHQELGAHMMMGFMMTKGRGHWGRDNRYFGLKSTKAYMAEYGPYKEL